MKDQKDPCNIMHDLDTLLDTCPYPKDKEGASCTQIRKAYHWASEKCRAYRLQTFDEKYPGLLQKIESSLTPKPGNS